MKILLKIFCKIVVSGYLGLSICFASVRGALNIGVDGKQFGNGDIVNSQLVVQPWDESRDIHFLKGYVGKTFLEHFYVLDIANIQLMDDSLTADLRLAIKKSFHGQTSAMLSHDGHDIPVNIRKNLYIPEQKNTEEFMLFEQADKKDWTRHYILWSLSVIAVSVGLWWGFHYYRKRKRCRELARMLQEQREKLILLMKNAGSKEDIQKLYAQREQMGEIFESPRQFKEALAMIDEHQYKSHIPEQVISEIRNKLKNGI